MLVKFAATTLTFPLLLRLERVLMRRRGVEDAELLDDTNPEGDAKEEAIFFLFFSVAREVRVKCVRNELLNEENEEETAYKTRRVKF